MNVKEIYEILKNVDKVSNYEFSDNSIKEIEQYQGSGFKGVSKEENGQWIIYTVSERKTIEDKKIVKSFLNQEEALKTFLIQKLRDIIVLQYRKDLYIKYNINLSEFNYTNLQEILKEIPSEYYCYFPTEKNSSYQLIEKNNSFSYQYIDKDGNVSGYNDELFKIPSWQVFSSFLTAVYILFMVKSILLKYKQIELNENDYFVPSIW